MWSCWEYLLVRERYLLSPLGEEFKLLIASSNSSSPPVTGARIGADPPAWKKWWAENRERFVPGAKREPRTSASGD